jgi:hypothetical protein
MLICNRSYLPDALEGWRRRATKRGLHIAMWDCVMTLFGPTVLVAPAPPPFYLRSLRLLHHVRREIVLLPEFSNARDFRRTIGLLTNQSTRTPHI